jgi:hypothetical protein
LQQQVDQLGNKHAGLARGPDGTYFTIAGPILNADGNMIGVAAVGKSLATLSQQIRQDTLAQVTFYGLDGFPIASSLLWQDEVFQSRRRWCRRPWSARTTPHRCAN